MKVFKRVKVVEKGREDIYLRCTKGTTGRMFSEGFENPLKAGSKLKILLDDNQYVRYIQYINEKEVIDWAIAPLAACRSLGPVEDMEISIDHLLAMLDIDLNYMTAHVEEFSTLIVTVRKLLKQDLLNENLQESK